MNKINGNIVYDWYAKDPIKLDCSTGQNISRRNRTIEDSLYIYLYQPGEKHRDKKRWATDFI